jgi:hypothetical protein
MPEIARSSEIATSEGRLLEGVYLPFLLDAQNSDGGWGYSRGGQSCVESTSWALLALLGIQPAIRPAVGQAGWRWLRERQLRDGSWPSFAGQPRGCWTTAPASLALYAGAGPSDQVARGLQWLADTWPAEGGILRRIGRKLLRRDRVSRQDESLRGWSWTPGTASWVEPTAQALIALRHIPEHLHPRKAGRRRRLAQCMLYDRMCPGGGWNSGNSIVYGAAGVPRIGPTAWALLALRDYRDRPENRQSLDWLEQAYPQIKGPESLALAHLCLKIHHRSVPALAPSLAALNSNNQFLGHTLAAAWAAISLSDRAVWLEPDIRRPKLEIGNLNTEIRDSKTETRDS